MTALLAIVTTARDANAAAVAGADRVALLYDGDVARAPSTERRTTAVPIGLMVGAQAAGMPPPSDFLSRVIDGGFDLLWLPLAPAWTGLAGQAREAGLPTVGVVSPDLPLDEGLCDQAVSAGMSGVLIGEKAFSGARLLDRQSPAVLARSVALCRKRELAVSLAGALEPPDVPRLLVVGPDELGFDVALQDPGSRFDPASLQSLRRLMRPWPGPGEKQIEAADPDLIFVRGWTVSMSIGAYARERGLQQRVRFSIEADLSPPDAEKDGMAGIVSYDLFTDAIARLVDEHVDLVETLAEDVASSVLHHPRVIRAAVTVEKLDVGPGSVGCRIVRRRKR